MVSRPWSTPEQAERRYGESHCCVNPTFSVARSQAYAPATMLTAEATRWPSFLTGLRSKGAESAADSWPSDPRTPKVCEAVRQGGLREKAAKMQCHRRLKSRPGEKRAPAQHALAGATLHALAALSRGSTRAHPLAPCCRPSMSKVRINGGPGAQRHATSGSCAILGRRLTSEAFRKM